jgi:ubiquinone/menaquinone biosynthesis C-methylase UbiE
MTKSTTEQVRQVWESQAGAWFDERDSIFASSRPVHEWLVNHLEPKDGQQVLEIGAGAGDTGFLAAPRLGGGKLVSTDLAPKMVEAARRRGAELGIQNAEYRVLDAQAMDLPDESFDAVLSRWGFMLMPDPAAAFRESRRVLKPGGRLVFAVFTSPAENPFAAIAGSVLLERGHIQSPPAGVWQPGILALADRSHLESLVLDAGFPSVALEPVDMTWSFPAPDGYWSFVVDLTAFGPLVRSLPSEEQAILRAEMLKRVGRYAGQDGVRMPSRCWGGVAIR